MTFFEKYYPLIIMGGILGAFALVFALSYALIKNKKESIGFDRNIPDKEIVKRLLAYAKPYWKGFAFVLLLMLFSISYDIVSPLLIGKIQGMIKGEFQLNDLFLMIALYASILIVTLVCSYAQAIILQKIGQKIVSNIRMDLFKHIETLSHEQLNHIPVGKLVTRVTNDTNGVSMMFTNIIVNLIKNCFVTVGVLVAMLCLNYALTLMILCFVPFVIFFTVIFRKFSRRAYRRVKDNTTDINTFLSENLSGIKITQFFNRENTKLEEFRKKNTSLGKAKHQQIFVFGIFRPMVYMLYIVSVLCLFFFGAKGALDGKAILGQTITSEIIVSFYMYISKFFNPIQSLAEQFNWLQSAFASAEKIFTIMDMQPIVVDEDGAMELTEVKGKIEFKNVWFAYENEDWVLKDVSFTVEAKQTVAFVGSTGSGKTTILSLICRNYDIQKGQILIDGIDIKKIKISSLRKHFGQMLQDVFLFSGTIRDNILLREENVSDEEVWQACEYVHADSFISKLQEGLDYEILERGNNFSAGQRQLLSFARTIVHKPKVMILDEATANIDTETEQIIQKSLEKMMNIGTMLIVAHRLSTIQHADKIIVLSHGKIIEEGDHFDLLKRKGSYYNLYTLQHQKETLLKGEMKPAV
ncbi:MAG: ABC transporter ATP-binding protein [Clostridia bacterium]|nr:ABC transporter ATP-binding protein [Clostridia bacterium]